MPFKQIQHVCSTPSREEVKASNGGIGTLWSCPECDQIWTYQWSGYFPDYNWIRKERWDEITEWQNKPWYKQIWSGP